MESMNGASQTSAQDDIKATVREEFNAGKDKAGEFAGAAFGAGKEKLDAGLQGSAETVDHVRSAIGQAASELKSRQMDGLAGYTDQLAQSLGSLSDRLRTSSVDQLASDARSFAKSHPALFVAGSIAVGFGLTRLLKAAQPAAGVAPAAQHSDRATGAGVEPRFEPLDQAEASTVATSADVLAGHHG